MKKVIIVVGAIVIAAILVFLYFGGSMAPYHEEDLEINEDVGGTWGTRIKLTDSDGNIHYITPDQTEGLVLLAEGVEFTTLEHEVSVKIQSTVPGEFDYVTFDYITDSFGMTWQAYYANNDQLPFSGQRTSDGVVQQIPVDSEDWTKCVYLDNPIIDMTVIDTYPSGEDYRINLYWVGAIKATPHMTNGVTMPEEIVYPPQEVLSFYFDIEHGALSYTWSDSATPT